MEAGSKSDAAKRRQPKQPGGSWLGFWRDATVDRKPWLEALYRQPRFPTLYRKHGRPALVWKSLCPVYLRNQAIELAILRRQPIVFGYQRVQP
jgi:hypothetical protein